MSHDDRDQAGGHPRRRKPCSGLLACLCCHIVLPVNSSLSRTVREREAARFEAAANDSEDRTPEPTHHQFLNRRCLRCGTRWIDNDLPEYADCPSYRDDSPIVYTTDSTGATASSHRIED